jgi:type IV secretory pathway TraG/TraD family ATPase VirD4
MIKQEFYRQVLLRRDKTRPSLFLCDEFQNFFTSDKGRGDAPFFERSRQSFHANVVATQNLSSLLRDTPEEETVHNFLGNCAVKLFLRNTEGRTNEYAAKNVFGEYLGFITTVGRSLGDRGGREGLRESASLSMTAQTLPVVPPERMTQLAIPDKERGVPYAEALVHLGSRATVEIDRLRFRVHPLDA